MMWIDKFRRDVLYDTRKHGILRLGERDAPRAPRDEARAPGGERLQCSSTYSDNATTYF